METILYFGLGGLGLGALFVLNIKYNLIDLSKVKDRFKAQSGTVKPPRKET